VSVALLITDQERRDRAAGGQGLHSRAGATIVAQQLSAPKQNRLSAVSSGTFSQDVLNVHLYGVFRKVEPRSNHLIGKTELQLCQDVLLPWRKVDLCFMGVVLRGTHKLADSRRLGRAGL
jgi:hypothetical protein